jgi:aryl-phospho-beta-D-glucosidase BglC (GH1 family)
VAGVVPSYPFLVKENFDDAQRIPDHFCESGARIAAQKCRFLVGIYLVAVLFSMAPRSAPAASTTTFLHTQGQSIVNESGEKILLRGVGLGNWMLPEGYMWKFGDQADRPRRIEKLVNDLIGSENGKRFWSEFRKNYITEADVKLISELGFNSVRPALNSRLFLPETGLPTGAEEGFSLLDNLIAWCKTNGVYVIIDMHAAPGGQTGQNIDDSANDQPELFMEPKYQDQLVALWKVIARRYQDEPTVAG